MLNYFETTWLLIENPVILEVVTRQKLQEEEEEEEEKEEERKNRRRIRTKINYRSRSGMRRKWCRRMKTEKKKKRKRELYARLWERLLKILTNFFWASSPFFIHGKIPLARRIMVWPFHDGTSWITWYLRNPKPFIDYIGNSTEGDYGEFIKETVIVFGGRGDQVEGRRRKGRRDEMCGNRWWCWWELWSVNECVFYKRRELNGIVRW